MMMLTSNPNMGWGAKAGGFCVQGQLELYTVKQKENYICVVCVCVCRQVLFM